jgi:hypothetical protein
MALGQHTVTWLPSTPPMTQEWNFEEESIPDRAKALFDSATIPNHTFLHVYPHFPVDDKEQLPSFSRCQVSFSPTDAAWAETGG